MEEFMRTSELNNVGYTMMFYFIIINGIMLLLIGYSTYMGKTLVDYTRTFKLAYHFTMIIILFVTSFLVTGTKCSDTSDMSNLMSTAAPISTYFLVFVLGTLSLEIFPGWIRGFSNTFGTSCISLLFYKTFLQRDIIKRNDGNQSTPLYRKLYEDPIPMFNELLPPNQDETSWISYNQLKENLHKLGVEVTNDETSIEKLKRNVVFKDYIGYIIWYFILGSISILFTVIQSLDIACVNDPTKSDKFREYTAQKFDEV